ncbi:hypothetical protein NLX83_39330 [Allokutzneria sp. A3M-2-11 16]|uniref:hypothetical protein n=1 Tax=Allokutzneria sp. A3M-2-11 16 TaxID=2962043 RepID=UPI0020B76426|nr:hypothetical protein [Allokutzneria sp. A3M-2-11 16]MCP3805336.1 hypothetical protein [Allokutzneria sp. A3M-2-11 16]
MPKHVAELRDVYDFLEEVRQRPGMWVRRSSVQHLDSILTGYWVALEVHEVDEQFDFGNGGRFAEWLWERRGGSSPLGWAAEVERLAEAEHKPAMEMFFALLDEYRSERAVAD